MVDIFSAGHRFRVRVTRFLSPLRDTLSFDKEKKEYVADKKVHVPIELSASFMNADDSYVRMLTKESFGGFVTDLSEEKTQITTFFSTPTLLALLRGEFPIRMPKNGLKTGFA